MEVARRGVRLAREAIAEAGREGDVAVAFALDAAIVNPDGPETVELLGRALAAERPDLVLIEGLSLVHAPIYSIVDGLRSAGFPVWLSFRRCPHGLCGGHGRALGAAPRATRSAAPRTGFEQVGADALLVNAIPPDHVDGMVAFLRDFTDLPLGVAPNVGYRTSDGWRLGDGVQPGDFANARASAGAAREPRSSAAAAGVEPEHIARGRVRARGHAARQPPRTSPPCAAPTPLPEPWRDAGDRPLYPLDVPGPGRPRQRLPRRRRARS